MTRTTNRKHKSKRITSCTNELETQAYCVRNKQRRQRVRIIAQDLMRVHYLEEANLHEIELYEENARQSVLRERDNRIMMKTAADYTLLPAMFI